MPTLNLDGIGSVTVGPEFLKLSHEEQNRTVDEIAAKLQAAPDARIQGAFDASQSVEQRPAPEAWRGDILPVSRDTQGNYSAAVPKLLQPILSTATLPGDVYSGRVDPRSDEAIKRSAEAAATISPASAAMKAGERIVPGVLQALKKPKVAAPTREELLAAGSAGYKEAGDMGVKFDPQAMSVFAKTALAKLEEQEFNEISAPHTFATLRNLAGTNRPYIKLSTLDSIRQRLRDAAITDSDRKAGKFVNDAIDAFTKAPPPATVMAGPAAAAGAVQEDARANWAALARSKEFSGTQRSAERRAKAANSGRNIDSTYRQRVASLLDQIEKGKMPGYSANEIAEMNNYANGTIGRNTLRVVSNILGGGGGTGALAAGAAGTIMGGPVGAVALPAIGWATKAAQNKLGKNAMNKLDETIRKRSPLYQSRLANAPADPVSPEMRAALLRASLLYGEDGMGGPQGGGGY